MFRSHSAHVSYWRKFDNICPNPGFDCCSKSLNVRHESASLIGQLGSSAFNRGYTLPLVGHQSVTSIIGHRLIRRRVQRAMR
jgi:hypothetical protein